LGLIFKKSFENVGEKWDKEVAWRLRIEILH
jgi:hypothetical protein